MWTEAAIAEALNGTFMRANPGGTFTATKVADDYMPPYGLPHVADTSIRNKRKSWNPNWKWSERETEILIQMKMDNQPFEVIRERLGRGRHIVQHKLRELKASGIVFPEPKRRVPDSMSIEFREKVSRLREQRLTIPQIVEALGSSYYKVERALRSAERVTVHGKRRAA